MKKNNLFIIISIFILLFTTNVNAINSDQKYYFKNSNNIEISKSQYLNLINLGFTDKQIDAMDIDEFNNNKNLNGIIVAKNTKYYKTIIKYYNLPHLKTLNSINYTSNTVEISEDEYNNSEINTISPAGLTNGYTETSYKKMTTTIIKNGAYYRYKNDLVWKKMPSTRSYDIQGIGIDYFVSGIPSSRYFKRIADINDKANSRCYYDTSTSGIWKQGPSGYVITFLLPSDNVQKQVTALSSYMYFDVQKLTGDTLTTLNAYGDYKHAQRYVDSSVSGGVSIGIGSTHGISFNASVTATIKESYDSMSTAQATLTNINW